jgi:diguanylate cyclase (GGDEF)-like protein
MSGHSTLIRGPSVEHYNAVHDSGHNVDEIVQQNAALGSEINRLRAQIEALELLVDTDTLTPLANRRAFTRRLEFEIGQTARHQTKTTIAFIDVNGLKKINDQYGHVAGDTALCHVADILLCSFRATDLVARIGGDEFAVILDHAGEDAIAARMEALGHRLADSPLDLEGTPFPISLAWGLTAIRGDDSVESAISRADAVMYGSKAGN